MIDKTEISKLKIQIATLKDEVTKLRAANKIMSEALEECVNHADIRSCTIHAQAVEALALGKVDSINGQLFSEELLANARLSDAECWAFRENSTKHTMQDPFYKDSITFYRREDGVVLMCVDSLENLNNKEIK